MEAVERASRNTKGGIGDGLIDGILEAVAKQVAVAETDAFRHGFESAEREGQGRKVWYNVAVADKVCRTR